ncbi:hypothetical protein [Microvirga yunnanensis]|uniref:hypothetical protein n=3 Tax=Microvirga TaxID=186650 RepID=UPI0021C6C949|nr:MULTISPECIES: hypothetical protein [unclassified Microvirga]
MSTKAEVHPIKRRFVRSVGPTSIKLEERSGPVSEMRCCGTLPGSSFSSTQRKRWRTSDQQTRDRQMTSSAAMPMMGNMMPGMMPMMGGMMPNMTPQMQMPMMGGMMPGMMPQMPMGGMMPMMGGMMSPMQMGGMMPGMMCRMSCDMAADGSMTCTMMPMEGMSADMFKMCCENMMRMMEMGMPCMMMCGGMMLVGMGSAMGAQTKPMKKSA